MKYHNSFLAIPLFLFSASAMSAVTPKITKISVTPTSAPAGTMFKFSAELNAPLTTGNKVKINLGRGLASMTGKNTSYSLSRAIYTTGKQTYRIGIYNAKNALQGKVSRGNYTVTSAIPTNHAPTLLLIKADTTAITNTAYTVTFNAKDIDGNLSSITMNWGDNSEPETLTATDNQNLVFSHIYTSASSFGWNAFASDTGTPALNSKSISKIVTVSNPEPVEVKGDIETFVSGSKTFSYTKIANDGSELPKTAKLGTGAKDWACTKDNNTGLIWEVKTDDGGLRDTDWMYSWYDITSKFKGYTDKDTEIDKKIEIQSCYTANNCNTYAYATTINDKNLCGANDWRVPMLSELLALTYCTDGKYDYNASNADTGYICSGKPDTSINLTYFPNIKPLEGYWSSLSKSDNFFGAWLVFFTEGFHKWIYKGYGAHVLLVRG